MRSQRKNVRRILHFKKVIAVLLLGLTLSFSINATNIAPIIAFLLDDDQPLKVPLSWNNEKVLEGQVVVTEADVINTLTLDFNDFSEALSEPISSYSANAVGDCYLVETSTLDPNLKRWDVIITDPGSCEISAEVSNSTQSLSDGFTVNINGIIESATIFGLLQTADFSEGDAKISGAFSFTNLTPWTAPSDLNSNPGAVFSDNNTPNLFEFEAEHKGVPLKGVMLTTTRKIEPRNFNDLNVDSRMSVRFVNGEPALIGSGKVVGSAGNTNTFAFIATGMDVSLDGPEIGREFHMGGKNKLNALCVDDRLVGFSEFDNERTLTKVSTSFVGFTDRDCTNRNNRFVGETGVFADFQAIDTHIGTILRGRGTAHPLKNGRITTVDDQDENDPDYAIYFLGLPEAVAESHAIVPLDSDTKFKDNVFIFDPFSISKIAKIRRNSGTMIFSEPPEVLQGISVGDVIVGKPSSRLRDGFLRVVTARGQQAGKFFLQTRPARLDEILDEGGFDISDRTLNFNDLEEIIVPEYPTPENQANVKLGFEKTRSAYQALREQQSKQAELAELGIQAKTINLPLPSVSFDNTYAFRRELQQLRTDEWRTEGRFELGASLTSRMRCKGTFCGNPEFLMRFDFTEDFELSGHVTVQQFEEFSASRVVATQKFSSIWIGPISIKPQIDIKVSISGNTDTDMQWGIDQNFTASLGLELKNGDWTTINEQSFSLEASPLPDYEAEDGTADLRARAAAVGTIKLSGIKIGGVDAGIYTDVVADTPRSPLWEVTAGLNSEAFVEIDILLTTIEAGPYELFDIPFDLPGGVAPDLPPEFKSIKVDGIEIEDGVAVRPESAVDDIVTLDRFSASEENPLLIKADVFDPEVGDGCCVVELRSDIDGLLETKAANRKKRFELTELSRGLHTITLTAIPTTGSPVSESFTMRILDEVVSTSCDDLDLRFFGGATSLSAEEPSIVIVEAELGGSCLPQGGQEIQFVADNQSSSSIDLVDTFFENGSAIARLTLSATLEDGAQREIKAFHVNSDGETISSNIIYLTTTTPFNLQDIIFQGDSGSQNDTLNATTGSPAFGGVSFGSSSKELPINSKVLSSVNQNSYADVIPPLLATTQVLESQARASTQADTPSNTEAHQLTLDNWGVGEAAYFSSPFPVVPNYEVSWETTDPDAQILVDSLGRAVIRPSKPGWIRVTSYLTYKLTDFIDLGRNNRRYRRTQEFYVSPNTNNKWRGYEQESPDVDATELPLMSAGMGGTNV